MHNIEVLGITFSLGNGHTLVMSRLSELKMKLKSYNVDLGIKTVEFTEGGFKAVEIQVFSPDNWLSLILHKCRPMNDAGFALSSREHNEYRVSAIKVHGLTWMIGLQLQLGLNRVDVVNKLYGRRSAGDIDKRTWNLLNGIKINDYKLLTSDKLYDIIIEQAGNNCMRTKFDIRYECTEKLVGRWDCVSSIWVTFDEATGKKVRTVEITAEHLANKPSSTMVAGKLI